MYRRPVGWSLAVLCLLAGLGSSPAAGQSRTGDAESAIQRLLERRATALTERDREAFLGTLYPEATDFRRQQARLFDRLAAVPLVGLTYSPDWDALGDLARPRDQQRYPLADEVRIPSTVERYRLRGYDKRAVIQDAFFTFVRDGEDWYLGSDDDLADVGIRTQKNPWDLDSVVLEEGSRILAVSSGCGKVLCDGVGSLLDAAESALGRVDHYWDRPWNRRVPFFVPGDPADLAEIIQATFPVDNYVAFAFWTGGAGKSEGARIIASPEAFIGSSSERTFSVLAHELTHVATLPYRGSYMPRFLDEGFAQYVQYDVEGRLPTAFDSAVVISGDLDLPEDYEFFIGDSSQVQLAYQKSLSAIAFLADRWGQKSLTRLYRAVGAGSALTGTSARNVDVAFEKVIGLDLDAFEEAWASSIAS